MSVKNYESFGRYPKLTHKSVIPIFWRNELPDFEKIADSVLPFAFGKSYGDSCLNGNAILLDTKGLNKLISIDEDNSTIRCEAGISLAEILKVIVPKSMFFATTPGTKHISVAGAIANDVHGKNHHKAGCFGNSLKCFELVRSNGEKILCSEKENSELFRATIGGLGLTGLITWAEFELKKTPLPMIDAEFIKFSSIDDFFELNLESENFEYTVSWVDLSASGNQLGRGIYSRGNHHSLSKKTESKNPIGFPFELTVINKASVFLFNNLYYNKQLYNREKKIVHFDSFFYPLDAIENWNKIYGKNGFLQYQFVIPNEDSKYIIKEIFKYINSTGLYSFLTVLKSFGNIKSPGLMSFPMPGLTLAVDFKFCGEKTLQMLKPLNKLIRDARGAIYPAKDAQMSAEDFHSFYPQAKEFKKFIDPKFSSSFWRRVNNYNIRNEEL